jgi:hypothetical protein
VDGKGKRWKKRASSMEKVTKAFARWGGERIAMCWGLWRNYVTKTWIAARRLVPGGNAEQKNSRALSSPLIGWGPKRERILDWSLTPFESWNFWMWKEREGGRMRKFEAEDE